MLLSKSGNSNPFDAAPELYLNTPNGEALLSSLIEAMAAGPPFDAAVGSETICIWRIASQGRTWTAYDLSGNGVARHPGRWYFRDRPNVSSSWSFALAYLETVVHLDGEFPLSFPRHLLQITITNKTGIRMRCRLRWRYPAGSVTRVPPTRFLLDQLNQQGVQQRQQ